MIVFANTPADIERFARFVKTLQDEGVRFTCERNGFEEFVVKIWEPEGEV